MKQREKQETTMIRFVSLLTLVIGVFQIISGLLITAEQVSYLGTAEGNAGIVALHVIMAVLGCVGVFAAMLGLRSIAKPETRANCKRIGMIMLIIASGFTVANIVLFREGLRWSYFMGFFSSICYLAIVK